MSPEELSQETLAYDTCACRLRLDYGVAIACTVLGAALGLLAHGTYEGGAHPLVTFVLTLGALACACFLLNAVASIGFHGRVKRHIEDRRRARGHAPSRAPSRSPGLEAGAEG